MNLRSRFWHFGFRFWVLGNRGVGDCTVQGLGLGEARSRVLSLVCPGVGFGVARGRVAGVGDCWV